MDDINNRSLYCRKCGAKLPADSQFCSYCGTPVIQPKTDQKKNIEPPKGEIPASKPYSYQAVRYPQQKSKSSGWKWFIIIAFAVLVIASVVDWPSGQAGGSQYSSTNSVVSESEDDGTALALPANGYIFEGENLERNSELTIECKSDSNCYIKMKNRNDKTVFSFFVRSGQTCKVKVPAQSLRVYFAYGTDWYGPDKAFGKNTAYAKDDELLDFSSYTFTYTLYPVTNGNFTETPISADEF